MSTTNQTARVLELIKRFNNGQKISIEALSNENLWFGKSEKTIRRDLDVIKEYFPDSYELVKGEKGCYKAITKNAFDNFINAEFMSLMVQMFNLANKSDLFSNFDLDENDKKILESKIKDSKKCYEFKTKPFENFRSDSILLKELENKIKHQKYINIEYEINGKINKFEVKPYKIIFINENFYLACGIDHEKLEFALYRLSKIKSIEDTSKTYHKNIEIEDFIKDIQTPFSFYRRDYKKHLINVVLEVDKSKAYYFENKKYLKSQEEKKQDDGSLLLTFKVTQEMEIEELVKRWIPFVKVIEPKSLKEKIDSDLKKYLSL
ncbi:helix-turn-helix transcriptional regulator [Aliarcobacter sp. ERUVET-7]|uniref:helix-turn-helix transcriptional regulator n=1 Tax=Aliarcobacter TaxID=2321111 RepID=UPI0021B515F2|nr:WYL domain-containing protein [Aliarcobacter cryaerophilus]MCT7545770.1 WYL domain-containing protein [Aliarcobacter cryaerophilus]